MKATKDGSVTFEAKICILLNFIVIYSKCLSKQQMSVKINVFGYGVIDLHHMHNNNSNTSLCSHNMTHKCRHLLNKLRKEHHNNACIREADWKHSEQWKYTAINYP